MSAEPGKPDTKEPEMIQSGLTEPTSPLLKMSVDASKEHTPSHLPSRHCNFFLLILPFPVCVPEEPRASEKTSHASATLPRLPRHPLGDFQGCPSRNTSKVGGKDTMSQHCLPSHGDPKSLSHNSLLYLSIPRRQGCVDLPVTRLLSLESHTL